MKAVQVVFDEESLARLDETDEVRRAGRSAVLRRLVHEHLRRVQEERIHEAYRRGYSEKPPDEFEGWEEAAAWTDD